MSIAPPHPLAEPPPNETLEEHFRRLEATWKAETAYISSSVEIKNHPAFQEIISLGEPVVPIILRELEKGPRLLVWVLRPIAGVNPVPKSDAGKIGKMCEAWLQWGREIMEQWPS